jgi:hypothetical protein
MMEKDSNVQDFNTSVCQLVNLYSANKREQVDTETLLVNLFDAYLICKDHDFVIDINDRNWNSSTTTSYFHLILSWKTHWTLVAEKTWGVETSDQKDIVISSSSGKNQASFDQTGQQWSEWSTTKSTKRKYIAK